MDLLTLGIGHKRRLNLSCISALLSFIGSDFKYLLIQCIIFLDGDTLAVALDLVHEVDLLVDIVIGKVRCFLIDADAGRKVNETVIVVDVDNIMVFSLYLLCLDKVKAFLNIFLVLELEHIRHIERMLECGTAFL